MNRRGSSTRQDQIIDAKPREHRVKFGLTARALDHVAHEVVIRRRGLGPAFVRRCDARGDSRGEVADAWTRFRRQQAEQLLSELVNHPPSIRTRASKRARSTTCSDVKPK